MYLNLSVMEFYNDQLFHIYNQGNNKERVFFDREDYRFFIWKMRAYLPEFGDLIAWCLMPNHFHWLFYVKKTEVDRMHFFARAGNVEWNRRVHKYGKKARKVERNYSRKDGASPLITLNEAIGILQMSYAKAFNPRRNRTGSLFRQDCKAKDGWIDEFITVTNTKGQPDSRFLPGSGYAFRCFQYIHENPVAGKLVKSSTVWEYSSAKDYAGLRQGSLCNLDFGKYLIESC